MAIFGFKTGTAVGLGVGYVLGTRAGRERYLQIMDLWTKVRRDKRVGTMIDKAVGLATAPVDQMRGMIGNGLRSASDTIEQRTNGG